MRPAPAANTASRVTSSASRGTNHTSLCNLRGGVDLGLLQPSRVVDVDRLPLREDVQSRLPRLAVAVARVLRAAKRQMHLGAGRPRVDVGDARLKVAHRAERLVDVAREDRRGKAVPDPVGDADRLVEVAHLDERRRRTEDLLLCDAHARVDVAEDGGPVEEALREIALGRDLAAGEQARALALADLRVGVDLLDRRAVD